MILPAFVNVTTILHQCSRARIGCNLMQSVFDLFLGGVSCFLGTSPLIYKSLSLGLIL